LRFFLRWRSCFAFDLCTIVSVGLT
jgi:hypothetical protein